MKGGDRETQSIYAEWLKMLCVFVRLGFIYFGRLLGYQRHSSGILL